jgi:tetratricopeptide (TPR) repeat protein/tRNA A-37 threonylcarbamoyl transferase component Bud32
MIFMGGNSTGRTRACVLFAMHLRGDNRGRVQNFLAGPADLPRAPWKYSVLREIGRGGMGVVYEAEDPQLKRRVALKVLRSDGRDRALADRLQREATIAAQLQHPNVVGVHEVGAVRDDGGSMIHFIAMDLVEGRTFADVLRAGTPRAEILRMIEDVARAVAYAHSKGVIHRDLKPANVLVEPGGRVLLTDFGLARAEGIDVRLTASFAVLGTPQYMSPEQVEGRARDVGPATDVYALGVMLYEALAGRLPFTATTPARLFEQILGDEPPPPLRSSDLDVVCLKAMDRDASRRYRSALEFADDLARARRGEPIVARPPSLLTKIGRGLRRRAAATIACGAVAIALAAVIAAVALGGASSRRQARALAVLEDGRAAMERAWLATALEPSARVERLAAAHARIEEATRLAPELAVTHHLLGVSWERRGDVDRAEAAWLEALRRDPRFAPARYGLGRRLLRRAAWAVGVSRSARDAEGLAEAARRQFELADGLEGADRAAADAMLAYARGDLAGAVRLAREGAARWTEAAELHWVAGIASAAPEDQRRAHEAALALEPGHVHARFGRGFACLALGNADDAERDFEAVVRQVPSIAEAWVNLANARCRRGELLARRGRRRDASEVWRRGVEACSEAVRLDAGLVDAYVNRSGLHWQLGDVVAARRDCDEALRLAPDSFEARVNRAASRLALDDPRGALEDADEAVRVRPSADAFLQRGEVLERLERSDAALADYDAVLREQPGHRAALLHRSRLLWTVGRRKEALADADAAVALDPQDVVARLRRAISRNPEDPDGALADATAAVDLDPRSADAYWIRAGIRRLRGDARGAADDYRRALEAAPSDWAGRPHVEEALRGLGE